MLPKNPLSFVVQEDGKLPIGIRETLVRLFKEMAGKHLHLTLTEAKERRNNSQNRHYWGVIIPHVRKVRAEHGDPVSEDVVHEDLLFEFAPRVEGKAFKTDNGKRPMRSKEMSVKEFSDYVTVITATMANIGFPVPLEGEL